MAFLFVGAICFFSSRLFLILAAFVLLLIFVAGLGCILLSLYWLYIGEWRGFLSALGSAAYFFGVLWAAYIHITDDD